LNPECRRIFSDGPIPAKAVFLPIEVMIVLAINIVVAVFGYYAITTWGLFSN
jgi:hypothetical protein